MIFPDLPQHRRFYSTVVPVITPTEPVPEPENNTVTAEAWFRQHFPDDPALEALAKPTPTPSFAEDPQGWIEFILLIVFLIAWVVFWKMQQ